VKKLNAKVRPAAPAAVLPTEQTAPLPAAVVPAPKPLAKLYERNTKFGGFSFYGADEVPAGAKRIDVADVYPVYVLEWGVGPFKIKLAFDVGRDA